MRILTVVHGYPPRETAGTEQHTHQLVEALKERGHQVHVVAATRAPGQAQYACLEADGVSRIVNNLVGRPLSWRERDPTIERILGRITRQFAPDLVHVQHIQFLSAGLRFEVPYLITLHDGWAWCAAGGTNLLPDRSPCPGPEPSRCVRCHAQWRPVAGRRERSLIQGAALLAPLIAPDRLHRVYQRLPPWLRLKPSRGGSHEEPPSAAAARNQEVLGFYRRAAARIAPSAFLAARAEAEGLAPVGVVRPGVAPALLPREGGGGLLYLGTLSFHKGTDLVVRAWRRAFPAGDPPLLLHGALMEAAACEGHPVGGLLDRQGVARALSRARALVLGSRWAENAPLVIVEARAAGCPVVAPAIGGIPELIEDGRDGLLYPPGDELALAACLARIVREPPRVPRAPRRFGQQVDEIEALYRRLHRVGS